MIQIKPGVKINGLKPEILLGIQVCYSVWEGCDANQPFVITEATGGKHGLGSLHYAGLAVDIRSKDLLPQYKDSFLTLAKAALAENYDLILEAENTANEHFHLEFQPK